MTRRLQRAFRERSCCALLALALLACGGSKRSEEVAGSGSAASGGSTRLSSWGERCSRNGACDTRSCPLVLGYCSKACTESNECPSFWRCENVDSSAQKFCRR